MRSFDVQGVCLSIDSDGSPAAQMCEEELALDFAGFPAGVSGSESPRVELMLSSRLPLVLPRHYALFRTRLCKAYGWNSPRVTVYGPSDSPRGAGLLDASDPWRLRVECCAPDSELLREIAYTASLSLTGELLDALGLHRVHALGLEWKDRRFILILPEGGGKSTLAMALLGKYGDAVRILSDEIPLVSADRVFPCPLRVAMRAEGLSRIGTSQLSGRTFRRMKFPEKRLFALSPSQTASAGRLDAVLLDGGRGHETSRLRPASAARTLSTLSSSLVVGLGVPQMREYFLRLGPLHGLRLGRIALSRAATAIRIASRCPSYVFERSNDPFSDAAALTSWIDGL